MEAANQLQGNYPEKAQKVMELVASYYIDKEKISAPDVMNYIKEAKYDMAVGHLLLKSFWANEAVFQMMMLSYNLFLLFKIDSLEPSEYRQQIKTFRLKYVFLAAKIIKTARTVIMNLSENYPYKEVYEKCLV